MAKRSQKTQADFRHTWFLQEWASASGLKQADVARAAGWSKATGSDIWNGQQYTQSIIDVVAPILNARPYELLMHPEEAFAIRRMREDAARIAADNQTLKSVPNNSTEHEPARRRSSNSR